MPQTVRPYTPSGSAGKPQVNGPASARARIGPHHGSDETVALWHGSQSQNRRSPDGHVCTDPVPSTAARDAAQRQTRTSQQETGE